MSTIPLVRIRYILRESGYQEINRERETRRGKKRGKKTGKGSMESKEEMEGQIKKIIGFYKNNLAIPK